ncbi:hypothetical protein OSCI_3540016 [Kamptonema sp. PCC 6506]|nr:hypothetical protein OSCI_3540016 [Kamptonema sp. PCC 6506]
MLTSWIFGYEKFTFKLLWESSKVKKQMFQKIWCYLKLSYIIPV